MSTVVFSGPLIIAQSVGNIVINSDGSFIGTDAINRKGNTYTLMANISGSMQIQRSNIVVDGAGYSLNQGGIDLTNGIGQDPTRPTIINVTIENLYVESGGISTNGGGNYTFYDDYIPSIQFLGDCINNNITFCTVEAISFDYGGNATLTENNLGSILVWLSFGGVADRNYWSDYLTKYSNATEIDSTGIGNTPYVYSIVETQTGLIYMDNHPLMKPVAIPLMDSNTLSPSTPTPTITQLPTVNTGAEPPQTESIIIVAITFVIALAVAAGLFYYFRKQKHGAVQR
jgi:hypothetical protein